MFLSLCYYRFALVPWAIRACSASPHCLSVPIFHRSSYWGSVHRTSPANEHHHYSDCGGSDSVGHHHWHHLLLLPWRRSDCSDHTEDWRHTWEGQASNVGGRQEHEVRLRSLVACSACYHWCLFIFLVDSGLIWSVIIRIGAKAYV